MSFDVEIGWICERGNAERNEDFAAAFRDARDNGLVAAIADGVTAGGHGLMAAQTTVRSIVGSSARRTAGWPITTAVPAVLTARRL
jgi:hypothetical protein